MKTFCIFAVTTIILCGCATTSPEQILLEQGATKLTPTEITQTFSGVRELYSGHDNPNVTAVGEWRSDGEFMATWKVGDDAGDTVGKWYVENGQRCIAHDVPLPNGVDTECHTIFKSGDTFTSLNPDGTVHGTSTISPL